MDSVGKGEGGVRPLLTATLLVIAALWAPAAQAEPDEWSPFRSSRLQRLLDPGYEPEETWRDPIWFPWERAHRLLADEGEGVANAGEDAAEDPAEAKESEEETGLYEGLKPRTKDEDYAFYEEGVRRVWIEVAGRLLGPILGDVKKGPESFVHKAQHAKDLGLPRHMNIGFSVYADVKVFQWASLGGTYRMFYTRGPRRHVHFRGVGLGSRFFPNGTRVRTRIEIQFAEITLRYVWVHKKKVHIWFGIGPGWGSYRVSLDAPNGRASARIENFFAPSLVYEVAGSPFDDSPVSFFMRSGISIGSFRLPTIMSEFRFGFRYAMSDHFHLVAAFTSRGGYFWQGREIWGGRQHANHKWKQARWSTQGLEIGLAVSF